MEFEPSVSIDPSSVIDASMAVDASAKYVNVSNGTRRVEAPDWQGYLMQVESGPANNIPDGRYDLSKAIEARAQADRTYDGQVIHKDSESIYQMAGHELVKHSMFELAKEHLPEIGAQIALSYAGGLPHVDFASSYTAASAPHAHKAVEQSADQAVSRSLEQTVQNMQSQHATAATGSAQASTGSTAGNADAANQTNQPASTPDVRKQAADDIDKVFRNQPGTDAGGAVADAAAKDQLAVMRTKIDADPAYGREIYRQHPDLFAKAASPEAQESMRKAIELGERADQAKTLAGKGEEKREDGNKPAQEAKGDEKERERRGFSMPDIPTSVEARAAQARAALAQAHSLAPLIAAKQIRENASRPQEASNTAKKTNTHQQKRGRSR